MDSLIKVKLMECPCYAVSENGLEQQILSFVNDDICGYSVAINAEKIYRYRGDKKLKVVIDSSAFPYPDGAGAVLAMKWLYKLASEKINMPIRVLEIANRNKLKVFVVGAKANVHEKAILIIKERYPHIQLVGSMHGYNSEEDIAASIVEAGPQIIMLAMGSPRQEIFASKLVDKTHKGFVIGCGGALDIIAGNLRRAPEIYINNNVEWLYRLVQEPWRWKRQLFLPLFALQLILQVFRH